MFRVRVGKKSVVVSLFLYEQGIIICHNRFNTLEQLLDHLDLFCLIFNQVMVNELLYTAQKLRV